MPVLSVTMTSGIGSQKERGSGVMRADTITAANVIAPVISIGLLITGQDERLARRRAKCSESAPGVSGRQGAVEHRLDFQIRGFRLVVHQSEHAFGLGIVKACRHRPVTGFTAIDADDLRFAFRAKDGWQSTRAAESRPTAGLKLGVGARRHQRTWARFSDLGLAEWQRYSFAAVAEESRVKQRCAEEFVVMHWDDDLITLQRNFVCSDAGGECGEGFDGLSVFDDVDVDCQWLRRVRVEWPQRSVHGRARSPFRSCDIAFWMQRCARPSAQIEFEHCGSFCSGAAGWISPRSRTEQG